MRNMKTYKNWYRFLANSILVMEALLIYIYVWFNYLNVMLDKAYLMKGNFLVLGVYAIIFHQLFRRLQDRREQKIERDYLADYRIAYIEQHLSGCHGDDGRLHELHPEIHVLLWLHFHSAGCRGGHHVVSVYDAVLQGLSAL